MMTFEDILTPAQLHAVRLAATSDPVRHDPRFATHAAMRDGEIVGALSVGFLQVVNVWSHSVMNRAIHTARIIEEARRRAHARFDGRQPWVTMCAANSPLLPFMGGLGFEKMGETILFEEKHIVSGLTSAATNQ